MTNKRYSIITNHQPLFLRLQWLSYSYIVIRLQITTSNSNPKYQHQMRNIAFCPNLNTLCTCTKTCEPVVSFELFQESLAILTLRLVVWSRCPRIYEGIWRCNWISYFENKFSKLLQIFTYMFNSATTVHKGGMQTMGCYSWKESQYIPNIHFISVVMKLSPKGTCF